jgi:hypothetical protein
LTKITGSTWVCSARSRAEGAVRRFSSGLFAVRRAGWVCAVRLMVLVVGACGADREGVLEEGEGGEGDDAFGVDVPLFVAAEGGAGLGQGFEEGVEGGGAAPFEVVVVLADLVPEGGGVARGEAFDALAVALFDVAHVGLAGDGGEGVAVAGADVGHVDAEDEEEAVGFAGGDIAEGIEERGDAGGVFGHAAVVEAAGVSAAEDGENADFGAVEVLQEQDLEFDGVFDRVAVVLHADGGWGFGGEFVDEGGVAWGGAEGGAEGFAGEAEGVGFAVVRGAKDDEGAVRVRVVEGAVGFAVGLPAAEGADVGGGDSEEGLGAGLSAAVEVLGEFLAGGAGVLGVGGAGVGGFADGGGGEFVDALIAQGGEGFVFEEPSLAERVEEVLFDIADLDFAEGMDELLAEVERSLFAVEAGEGGDDGGRDEEHGVGEFVGVADEEAGALGVLGGDEIEAEAKAG